MDGKDNPANKTKPGASETASPALSAEIRSQLHSTAKLTSTLYDLAHSSLAERSRLTGEPRTSISTYHELNRIMELNGYPSAHINGRAHVTDKNLPKDWNNVHINQDFALYDRSGAKVAGDKPPTVTAAATDAEREVIRKAIVDETSTLPVKPGEGYFQVLRRMHPELPDEKTSSEAHRIKKINHDRDVLVTGERLPTATEEERARELERRLRQHKGGGSEQQQQQPVPPARPGDNPPAGKNKPEDSPLPEKLPVPPVAPGSPVKPGDLPANPLPPGGPGGPVPPGDGKDKPAPAQPSAMTLSMDNAYAALKSNYDQLQTTWQKECDSQGVIGRSFDAAKNNVGSSAEGRAWYDPRRIWSNVFDSDLGSKAIQDKLTREGQQLAGLKKAVDAHDENAFRAGYKGLTGVDFDPSGNKVAALKDGHSVGDFDKSQRTGVDTTTDIASALAAVISLRCKGASVGKTLARATTAGAFIGGTTKAGLMQIDGKYANLPRDFAMGSVMGGSVPLSELAGSQASRFAGNKMGLTVSGDLMTARIETQGVGLRTRFLSAALKTGTGGAVFGAIESPSREAVTNIQEGKSVQPLHLVGLSMKGAALGFVGGTLLGGVSDRVVDSIHVAFPGKVIMPGKTINGVDIPASGTVGLEDASKILKIKPEDFAAKAAKNPYGAVEDAVQLYEKTGLNIQKVDPLTGKPLLPKEFADALSTVQNVELLTADSGVQLTKKLEVVKSTDAFVKQHPDAIEDPLKRLTSDPKFKKVMKLKGAGGEDAAAQFEQQFKSGFENDVKTTMSVERVKNGSLSKADALSQSVTETEAAYKQKAADFFKDMTNPTQRKRLNALVDGIYDKFNPELVSREQLRDLLENVPKKDRPLAIALLHESAGSSSDTVLTARLKSLRTDIANQTGSAAPNEVFTLAPNSSGNLLGYLYRKSNSMSMGIRDIDSLAARVKNGDTPQSIVLFDDLSTTAIPPATRELLKKIPKVYVVDLGAFEKGVNVIDYAKGPQEVANKLNALLDEARKIKTQNPKLLPTAVARQTLSGAVDDVATGLGPNVTIIRPTGRPNVKYQTLDSTATAGGGATAPGAASAESTANGAADDIASASGSHSEVPQGKASGGKARTTPGAANEAPKSANSGIDTKENADSGTGGSAGSDGSSATGAQANAGADAGPHTKPNAKPSTVDPKSIDELYVALNVPKASKEEIAGFLSSYAGQDRELAAQMIAEGAEHNSFPVMVQKAVALHQNLDALLKSKGSSMQDVVMVSDKDPGGSTHLVTYLFGNANGLSEANFVSSHQLDQMLSSGAARNKVLAYFDDTIYSGSQTSSMLESNIASLSPFKRVVVAGLGSYEKGVQKIRATHLGQIGKVDVASANSHYPFYSDQHPFYSKLAAPQKTAVKTIGGSDGFGTIQGSVIWPYMYPDNNIDFFGSKFSGGVLHLPGP